MTQLTDTIKADVRHRETPEYQHSAPSTSDESDGDELERPVVSTQQASIEAVETERSSRVADARFEPVTLLREYLLRGLALCFSPNNLRAMGTAVVSLSLGVMLWHWASDTNFNWFVNFENVPSPSRVFSAFLGHLQTSVFYIHIGVSMKRILISYSLAVILGIAIGVVMGRSVVARRFLMPYIEVVRPIPAVAWIPLAILMWPTEESSIIYITFLGALFPIVLNTLHGVEQTPEVLVRAAQSLGASRKNIFLHVVLPAALPSISAGLAIGMGVSWFSLLAGEIISGQYGIGYFTWDAYSLINYQDIVVGMLVIGFLGTLSTAAIKLMTRPMLKWQLKAR